MSSEDFFLKSSVFVVYQSKIGIPGKAADIISLITGWTVYTEKYKARGLYEGPRDLYFSWIKIIVNQNSYIFCFWPPWAKFGFPFQVSSEDFFLKSSVFVVYQSKIGIPGKAADIISLITGWTVYTEKYKARGLYEGPRDLYFSYRQSNQLLRSLLHDWNIQNMLGKICAECKLMENSAINVIIYRFRFSGKFPKIHQQFSERN